MGLLVTLYKVAGLFMIKPFMSNIFSAVLRSVPPGWWVVICACCMVPHGDDVKHFRVKKEKEETKWSLSVRTTWSEKMPGGESIDVLVFIFISSLFSGLP